MSTPVEFLIVYDFPLTWHDMQALAGFRCLPADKHLAAMQAACAAAALPRA